MSVACAENIIMTGGAASVSGSHLQAAPAVCRIRRGTNGCDAYAVVRAGPAKYLSAAGLAQDRFIFVDPANPKLPYEGGSIVFTFGTGEIKHAGIANGHSDRLPAYHGERKEHASVR